MMKYDLHLHMCYEKPKQSSPQAIPMETAEAMRPYLEELGIDRGMILSVGEANGSNAACQKICQAYPEQFRWMCNLERMPEAEVLPFLQKQKADGALGVGELMINLRLDHPFLQAVFAAAESLGLPVLFHMSPEEGYNYGVVDLPGLPLLESVLQDFPQLMVIGHSQPFWIEISKDAGRSKEARNAWGEGPVLPGGRIDFLFDHYPQLYADLSANSGGCAIMRDPVFGLAFLERHQDRLFFGSDMVNTEGSYPLGAWLDEQWKAGALSTPAYRKICRENALRFFP